MKLYRHNYLLLWSALWFCWLSNIYQSATTQLHLVNTNSQLHSKSKSKQTISRNHAVQIPRLSSPEEYGPVEDKKLKPHQYVVYWGQNSYGASHPSDEQMWEKPLADYCQDSTVDILIISFLHVFNIESPQPPEINLSFHCNTTFTDHPNLLSCPTIGQHIQQCQDKGKKILLSMGGAAGSYGFRKSEEAAPFAHEIWEMFLGGTSEIRPFGSAILDGVDLDIEGGSSLGYPEFVHTLRELYVRDTRKKYFIGGAPQCTYPDVYFGPALEQAWFDYLFVQFYNNYCGINFYGRPAGNGFNFEQWDHWAKNVSINPQVKVLLGIPESPSAANMGYMTANSLRPILTEINKKYSSFGGVMTWDASQADNNRISNEKFSDQISNFIKALDPELANASLNSSPSANSNYTLDHSVDTFQSETPEGGEQDNNEADSSNNADDNNVDSAEVQEGAICQAGAVSCFGNSKEYALCVNGIWILMSCPVSYFCSTAALKSGLQCQKQSGSDQIYSTDIESQHIKYDIDMIPGNQQQGTMIALIIVRTKSVAPISSSWEMRLEIPTDVTFVSTSLGTASISSEYVIIKSDSSNENSETELTYMRLKWEIELSSKYYSGHKSKKINNSNPKRILFPLKSKASFTDLKSQ